MTDHWQVIEDALNIKVSIVSGLPHGEFNRAKRLQGLHAALAFVREMQQQLAQQSEWEIVDYITCNGVELYADELAVTIGWDNTAYATMEWPEEGKYAVCRRKEQPHDAQPKEGGK